MVSGNDLRTGGRRCLVTLLTLAAGFYAFPGPAAQVDPPSLGPGSAVEGMLTGGEVVGYPLELGPARPVVITLEQRGVDGVLEVLDGTGEPVIAVDGPLDREGVESVLLTDRVSDVQSIRVRAAGAERGGSYRLSVRALQDSNLVHLEELFSRAGVMVHRGGADAVDAALSLYREAASLAEALGRRADRARALSGAAALARRQGRMPEARALYRRALPLWRELGERGMTALTLNDLALTLWQLGDVDASQRLFRHALETLDALDRPRGEAVTRANLCFLLHSRDRLAEARRCYLRALDAFERLGERSLRARILISLGGVDLQQGEPGRAVERFRTARAISRTLGERRGEALAVNNLAAAHRSTGRLDAARNEYSEALELFRTEGDARGQARALNNLGFVHLDLGEPERAVELFRNALSLRRETGDRRGEATTLNNLGRAYREQGRPRIALAVHRQALEIHRQMEYPHGVAVTEQLLGAALLDLGKLSDAAERLASAASHFEDAGKSRRLAAVLELSGRVEVRRGRGEAAHTLFDEAHRLFGSTDDTLGEARALEGRARVERLRGSPGAALATLEEALELLESVRAGLAEPGHRASFLAWTRRTYELAVALHMERARERPEAGHQGRALEAAERGRARMLLDLLAGAFDDEAVLAVAELPTVEEIRDLLDPETVLVEYFLGEERSWGWVVSSRGLDVAELPPRPAVEAAAERLHGELSTLDPTLPPGSGDRPAARELADLILRPIADRLGLPSEPERLVIVPSGALHYVPFAALPLPAAGEGATGELVLDHFEVVTAPSAASLVLQRRSLAERPRAPGAVAVLADPVFAAGDPRLAERASGKQTSTPSEEPERLWGTRREAEVVERLAGHRETWVATGFDAARERLLDADLARFRVLHLATHGRLDASRPERSGLVLSRFGPDGRRRDGLLDLETVHGLELGAELVVLSGCETALGRELRGEGLVGLVQGFLHAGARRVMASLWRVDDRATAELMERFYRALWRDDLTAPAALRRAQRALRREGELADPYYWAGMIVVGD